MVATPTAGPVKMVVFIPPQAQLCGLGEHLSAGAPFFPIFESAKIAHTSEPNMTFRARRSNHQLTQKN